ncbi:sigma-70 family RNA polymerase sigma factor [Clostridium sp. A1-XYC3]|uniref:Sigma-70 family RNA polymerase sigma factor n=1 Tax=Clostridium tanneri TaxID=3037988 RepID=A0ABU4JVM6_9CLOT|nr:sigma-70 family RNA polymerase sigma factor [Clostridium sp. A1-XYC3]MDW8802215.1 sigma-70 family RNA polymerase sigma factor [Clostridium sp. A1-XYC3]
MIKNNIDVLIMEAQKGNKDSLEKILNLYKPLILKNARQIYINGYETEDLIQIGSLSLVKAVYKYQADRGANFTIFAAKVIKNTFNEELRKVISKKWDENFKCSLNSLNKDGIEFIEILHSPEDLEETVLLKEKIAMLKKAINNLPEDEREIINWFYLNNKSLKEYAAKEDINVNTVVKRKSRALGKLKRYFLKNYK